MASETRPTWVVQTNLGRSSDEDRIFAECKRLGLPTKGVEAIPFSPVVPVGMDEVSDVPCIVYGATGLTARVHEDGRFKPGVFFNDWKFLATTWMSAWGMSCLNYEAIFTSIKEFGESDRDPGDLFFVRPVRDLKEFAGDVQRFGDFKEWYQRISHGEYTVGPDCPIVVADPKNIPAEYRCFMVDGKVSSSSLYRRYGRLTVEGRELRMLSAFAERMDAAWRPAPIYSLDIATVQVSYDETAYKVVECGCFNSSGFYGADIEKIVGDVSRYVEEHGND